MIIKFMTISTVLYIMFMYILTNTVSHNANHIDVYDYCTVRYIMTTMFMIIITGNRQIT